MNYLWPNCTHADLRVSDVWNLTQQECIPVGCVPPAYMAATRFLSREVSARGPPLEGTGNQAVRQEVISCKDPSPCRPNTLPQTSFADVIIMSATVHMFFVSDLHR